MPDFLLGPAQHTRVPNADASHVIAFCNRIVPGAKALLLPTAPDPLGQPKDCFETVRLRIASQGGAATYGWSIWEWPGVMIEAEFHAVWRDQTGALCDISPQSLHLSHRLFLPDSQRVYGGRQVNNIRQPLTDHPAVARFIAANDRHFEVMNRGERADQHGIVMIPPEEIAPVMQEIAAAYQAILSIRPGRNDPCACGSGRKFKKCCGAK